MTENPAIRRYTITNTDWVLIAAPILCNTFSLLEVSGKAFIISSDIANPLAQDTVPGGRDFGFNNPYFRGLFRYQAGTVILALKAVDGAGATVVAYFGY